MGHLVLVHTRNEWHKAAGVVMISACLFHSLSLQDSIIALHIILDMLAALRAGRRSSIEKTMKPSVISPPTVMDRRADRNARQGQRPVFAGLARDPQQSREPVLCRPCK